MKPNYKELLSQIKFLVFDIDGVLTDGSLIIMPDELIRTMNIRDGYAMKAALKSGINIAIISGGLSESVRTRLQKLGIKEIFLGVENKTNVLDELVSKYNLQKNNILFMGDDLPDLEVMQKVGFPCCPADASPEIKELSVYISPVNGGKGCVRDIIEQIMRLNKTWPSVTAGSTNA